MSHVVEVLREVVQLVVGVTIGAYIGTKIAQWEMKRSVRRCLEDRKCIKKWLELMDTLLGVLRETEGFKEFEKIAKALEELLT